MGAKPVKPKADPVIEKVATRLMLSTSELNALQRAFNKLDKNRTGYMAKSDFLNRVAQMPANKWTESLFTLLDFEENSEMSFSDFLLVLSTYCMFDADAVVKLVFFSFDRDKNGKIDMEELMELLVALHGKNMDENVKLAVETIDKGGFDITYKELRKINKVYPALLYPAFRMQVNMRHYAMGMKWWQNKMQAVVDYQRGLLELKSSTVLEKELSKTAAPAERGKSRMRLLSKRRSFNDSGSKGGTSEEEEEEDDLEVERTGLWYFCCRSKRVQVIAQAQKLKQMEKQLNQRLDEMVDKQLAEEEAAKAAAAAAASITPSDFI